MALFLCNNPAPTPVSTDVLLAEWDFTQDTDYLVDKIRGIPLTAYGCSHNSNGVTFSASGGNARLYNEYLKFISLYCYFKFEIDIGDYSLSSSSSSFNNGLCQWRNSPIRGICRFGNNSWAVYNRDGLPDYLPDATDINFFKNSTLGVEFNPNNKVKIYKNNSFILSIF